MNRSPLRALIEKEGIASLLYLAFSLFLAIKVVPGVGTSGQVPLVGQAAAPWIFGPVQVLLFYFPPWIAAILFPILILSPLVFLPWISGYLGEKAGRTLFAVIGVTLLVLLLGFMLKERVIL